MVKRISALAAVLLCVFMLCSCTASRSQIGAYVRGTLDSVYLNENSDEYLESVGGTAEECETQYQHVHGYRRGIRRDLSAHGEDIRNALCPL